MLHKDRSFFLFNLIAYIAVSLLALICLIPFITIVSGSLTDNATIITKGYRLFPLKFSVAAYASIFQHPQSLLSAYRVTIVNTLVGTIIGLFIISMTGFVLAQNTFKYRNIVSFLIYFTSIFGGGLIPWYIVYVKILNLKDNLWALCLPGLMNPFLIILMRTFIAANLPGALVESAKIDGAGYFNIFLRIALPVCKLALATIGLFLAIGYWNDWYLSSIFITSTQKYELQYYLYNMINGAESLAQLSGNASASVNIGNLPTESVKLAMAVMATGPVILFYPFVQKYFVQGITVGAVKG